MLLLLVVPFSFFSIYRGKALEKLSIKLCLYLLPYIYSSSLFLDSCAAQFLDDRVMTELIERSMKGFLIVTENKTGNLQHLSNNASRLLNIEIVCRNNIEYYGYLFVNAYEFYCKK